MVRWDLEGRHGNHWPNRGKGALEGLGQNSEDAILFCCVFFLLSTWRQLMLFHLCFCIITPLSKQHLQNLVVAVYTLQGFF